MKSIHRILLLMAAFALSTAAQAANFRTVVIDPATEATTAAANGAGSMKNTSRSTPPPASKTASKAKVTTPS